MSTATKLIVFSKVLGDKTRPADCRLMCDIALAIDMIPEWTPCIGFACVIIIVNCYTLATCPDPSPSGLLPVQHQGPPTTCCIIFLTTASSLGIPLQVMRVLHVLHACTDGVTYCDLQQSATNINWFLIQYLY
jgi:hypothetical protein